MSAVYDVHVELRYQDRDALIGAMNDFIDENDGTMASFSLNGSDGQPYDRDDLTDLVKVFITDRGFYQPEPDVFDSAFNASYGWESVMMEMFDYIAPYLDDGSVMEIYPDSGHDLGEVVNGDVIWSE